MGGFETEGIFRTTADQNIVEEEKVRIARDEYTLDFKDPHIAANLLRDWLRGLEQSIIPCTLCEQAHEMAKNNQLYNEALHEFLSLLPELNRECLIYLIIYLRKLQWKIM